ncbi:SRPBCC domain-containing protein [Dyadobacter sp. CY261]|uniref:SRPBCC family protein n=1 Tax=Dyadobacter sp. CY261 TaxID=2907203 RepID=UPI001F1F39F8|nr:SRPBCC domain-containing protein [Dyadobacter sp. CY261]MCF0074239.1 SRPBCC domain-containing protein [Dyadobacter sp. CY261]
MTKIIKHQFSFSHPVETVWEYLTNSELLASWLMKNDFKPAIGHEFQFRTGPIAPLNFDGIIYCKVLDIVPLKHLSYSWNSGPGGGEITLESVVNWNLEPTESGTTLHLEHSGFAKKENLDMYNGLLLGWVEKLEKIANLLKAEKYGDTSA